MGTNEPIALEVVKVPQAQAARPLSTEEAKLFEQCEAQIGESLYGFLEMGNALLTIHRQELYRQTYATFDDYCRDRWQIGKAYAYRLIAAAEVVSALLTRGDIAPPQMEAQVRPLVGLERSVAVRVWQRVVTEANGEPITSKMVKQVVAAVAPAKEPPKRKARRRKKLKTLPEILKLVNKARLFVERGYQDNALRALQTIERFLEGLLPEVLYSAPIPDSSSKDAEDPG